MTDLSIKKIVLMTIAAVLIVCAAFVFVAARKIYTPTEGIKISRYADPKKALLVIDVQEDYTGLNGKKSPLLKGVDSQILNINRLIDLAAAAGMEVAYIRQIFDNNFITRLFIGRTIEGLPGTELDSRIKMISQNDFTKKISDAFSNPSLEEFLIKKHVNEVYLVGLDAAYCVYYTALGAKNRGYKVAIVKDAVMTRKNMNDILNQYEKDEILTITSGELLDGFRFNDRKERLR